MFKIQKASRKQVKLKIGFFGPSGSGKTYSALRLAKGLVGSYDKIAVIDTENESAALYSHLGDFLHLDFRPPYDPRKYIEAIKQIESQCPSVECIIIDSISHEWEGDGGCLQIQERLGGRIQDWAKVTPLHTAFIQAIVQSPSHIIVCGRTKIDYNIGKDNNSNKTKVEKLGTKAVTREGFDYELTLSFRIDENHNACIDKDRTSLFKDMVPNLITEEIGIKLKTWNELGEVEIPEIQIARSHYLSLQDFQKEFIEKEYSNTLNKLKDKKITQEEVREFIEILINTKEKNY